MSRRLPASAVGKVSVSTPQIVDGARLHARSRSSQWQSGSNMSRARLGLVERSDPKYTTHGGETVLMNTPPTQAHQKTVDINSFAPRERILAAALKLFVEQGYFNTNVPDLSRESKCSVGSIYHTFKNKEEIASALYNESISAFRRALERSIAGKSSIEDVVKTLVRSFLEFSEVNHQVSRYIWLCRHNEFMTGIIKHPTTVGFDRLGRQLTKALRKGVRDGLILDLRANIMWSAIFGLPLAYVRDWLDGYNQTPPSAVAQELADISWRALAK